MPAAFFAAPWSSRAIMACRSASLRVTLCPPPCRLKMSPTSSRAETDSEKRVGRRLVERRLGGYRLTELGEELLPDAEGVEAAVATLNRHPAACDKGLTGTVRRLGFGSTSVRDISSRV